MTAFTAPVLVIGWGNPSRGDDALGPLFVEELSRRVQDRHVEWLSDFQLQVEHALDLAGRERVLFVDASLQARPPFEVVPLTGMRDRSFTTHALSPAALLQVFHDIGGGEPPACTLLAIRGDSFALGEPPGAAARANLAEALAWGERWLAREPADA